MPAVKRAQRSAVCSDAGQAPGHTIDEVFPVKIDKKYRHGFALIIFMVLYLICFYYLEKSVGSYKIIHLTIDDYIPFCEYFVIPYYLWFPYIIFVTAYFCIADRPGLPKLTAFLMIGMTVFLLTSFLYPNGQDLRPISFERDNMFVDLVKAMYASDTPTNVLPSIHVLNTLGVQMAILNDSKLRSKRWVTVTTLTLSALIIMSTVFIKQHSMMDVILACILAVAMYALLYREDYQTQIARVKKKDRVLR